MNVQIKMFKNIDWILVFTVICIFIIGMIVISSATHVNDSGSFRQLQVQAISFVIGIVIISFILLVDYNKLGKYYKQIYILNILLLLAVYIPGLGVSHAGARSWIKLGPIDFQTSEIVKLGFIISFAKFLEDKKDKLNTFKDLIPVIIYAGPILLLILKQPDLGTAIVFMSIIFGMTFITGLNAKIIGYGGLGAVFCIPIIYKFLKPHQRVRIDAFLHPGDPKYEGNFQVIQSMIAIGSGKIFGKGLFKGTQNQYNFLPVQETDFIFAVLGEEFGLLGGIVLVLLFLLFLVRILKIAKNAKDFYGSLITVGVLFMFLYQIVQNIGMAIGLMPVTGVTLPFVSYGGSSLVTSMMALGLILNVSMRRKKINF
ncbi:rod shape-determining protein RodA [Tepidibacter thalassicus]|uniref:Peptidoglycan glycosyltransferase RodA n=1 Tax=Tepidibacter thalassicus DSM 15285 TaxID=1123350 RepID=A0A1M5NFE6_9FIRM|nr:rod shape-determining protein RodA [Tepidibacter thalassicus]SHG88326.1 rod shape determining protein RodA [Tepidibacter thalassicus DSM 15285]